MLKSTDTISTFGKAFFILLVSILLFPSCDLFKSVPKEEKVYDKDPEEIRGGKVYNPETGKTEVVDHIPMNMDTVDWRRNPSTDAPPIGDDATNGTNTNSSGNTNNGNNTNSENNGNSTVGGNYPTTMKSTYEIAMMLPFVTNRFNYSDSEIYKKSEWAIQYYAGAKLALEKLSSEGVNLNINVIDTEGSESKVNNELKANPVIKNADLIIGPYRSVNVRKVAEFGKANKIPVVSPYSAASNISIRNPHLIQVNPSLNSHIEAITQAVAEKHMDAQVVLVVRNRPEEKARLAIFQDALRQLKKTTDVTPFKEFVVDDSDGYEDLPIRDYMNENGKTVFIVPSWSNEVFVNTFLRQVEITRKEYENIIVFGMPQWMEFSDTDYTYYEKLKVHVSSTFFINKSDFDTRTFRQSFYDRFGKKADKAAYLGYDVTLYFGRQINKGGTQFQQSLPENNSDLLHSSFNFEPIYKITPGADANAPTERFENKFVHILKFVDYQWIKE